MTKAWLLALVALTLVTTVHGHDGGFGHSRRTIYLAATKGGFVLEYRIQHNRDDALVEMTRMDADGDGAIATAEKETFFRERARQLAAGLEVKTSGGEGIVMKSEGVELGQALVQTYRYSLITDGAEVWLEDRNFPHKPGLVFIRHDEGLTITLDRQSDLTHADRVSLRVRRAQR